MSERLVLLIKNVRLSNGHNVSIEIENGRVSKVGKSDSAQHDAVFDGENLLALPGIIDVHTHIRDMQLSHKEDWLTASRAAAAGGVCTIFDMPNTRPATFDQASLEVKRRAAAKSIVNYGYNFGVTESNHDDVRNAGPVNAVKMFMAESSSGYVVEDIERVREVFYLCYEMDKPLMVHSELQSCVEKHEKQYDPLIANHNKIRNRVCALKATERLLSLAAEIGTRLYIVHVSCAEEIELIRAARQSGIDNVYCEVTPHHLFLNEDILVRAGNYGKVNPPLRTSRDNAALYEAIVDGTVDTIGTDHAPHGLDEKNRPYNEAPAGFPGLETSLSLMLQMVHRGDITLRRLEDLMCHNPARIFELKDRGHLMPGYWADIALVDPGESWTVDPVQFFTKARYSPFSGLTLKGKVKKTFVNGTLVFDGEKCLDNKGKEVEFA